MKVSQRQGRMNAGAHMMRRGAFFEDGNDPQSINWNDPGHSDRVFGNIARSFGISADEVLTHPEARNKLGGQLTVDGLTLLWGRSGFPSIQLSHRLAAAFMCTRYQECNPLTPWPCFEIQVPHGLVFVGDHVVNAVLCSKVDRKGWCLSAFCDSGAVLPITQDSLGDNGASDFSTCPPGCDHSNHSGETRVRILVSRLVASVCLAIQENEKHLRPVGKHSPINARDTDEPRARNYVLGRPVSIDCRATVADYLSGKRGNTPKVQWMVRGHWRNQAHGEGHLQRKVMWIEPHWKGPSDAPINVRSHVFDEGADT